MTLDDIARAIDGTRTGSSAAEVSGFSIDTRTLRSGDLFFAIRGPRFDGHAFVADALARGACGAVVGTPAGWDPTDPRPRIVVRDTVEALQALGAWVRRASGTRVVAVTGSAGKTTTKEIAGDLVALRYRVFKTVGNLNNEIGLPLSLLELRHRPDVAIVELGMNHSGELRRLVRLAQPDVRVWTNVGEAHLGFFPSVDAIADAKAEILDESTVDTVLIANANDPRVVARIGRFPGRVKTFGMDVDADVQATDARDLGTDGTTATVRADGQSLALSVPLLGLANLSNALAGMSVGLHFGLPLAAMVEAVARLRPAAHRGVVRRLPGDVTVIDDAYNSNPSALRAMLATLRATAGTRRVAVLGEMLELGERSIDLHTRAGADVRDAGVGLLITIGGEPAGALADAAISAGMTPSAVVHVGTSAEAADLVAARVRPGDVVLVKGSRGIGTELVVDRLLEGAG